MLILERSHDRAVCIGRDIKVHLVEVLNKRRVKLGIEAPPGVPIWREETGEWRPQEENLPPEMRFSILVVEDDIAQAKIITRTLAQAKGVDVTLVKTGAEAREVFERFGRSEARVPNLILMDYRLPDANGDELVRSVRAVESLRAVPIVMLSCADSRSEIDDCLEAGATAFMTKPANYHDFRDSVLRIVDFWSTIGTAPMSSVFISFAAWLSGSSCVTTSGLKLRTWW